MKKFLFICTVGNNGTKEIASFTEVVKCTQSKRADKFKEWLETRKAEVKNSAVIYANIL